MRPKSHPKPLQYPVGASGGAPTRVPYMPGARAGCAGYAAGAHELEDQVAEIPTLFVCHGDDGGPRVHPCRRVQEALRASGIEYDKVVAAHGNPIPFLRKGSRDDLRKRPARRSCPHSSCPTGRSSPTSRAILAWVDEQQGQQ